MSFFLIDFEACRAHGRAVAALEEPCMRLARLLREGGAPEELAKEAEALGNRAAPLGEAILSATAEKEARDMETLRMMGGLDEPPPA